MSTLFNSQLSEREFSSHLVHTGDLLAWAESKRLHLRSKPDLNNFEFVQVEALLCAIERQSQDLTPEQAVEIVLNHPLLKNDPAVTRYPDDIDPSTCRWLLGADAHQKWRVLLTGAIQRHELSLLDFASKLPIEAAPATDTATPELLGTESVSEWIRGDLLTPLIEKAQLECRDPYNASEVFVILREAAKAKTAPFIDVLDEGLKWVDSNDSPKTLTLALLRDRLYRQKRQRVKAPTSAKTR